MAITETLLYTPQVSGNFSNQLTESSKMHVAVSLVANNDQYDFDGQNTSTDIDAIL